MHVVADASPLRYLILIGHIDLLPALFTQIIIPRAVLGELQRTQTPPMVRRWMQPLPVWGVVRAPQ
jgi:predicted nucleic acid-binding protein